MTQARLLFLAVWGLAWASCEPAPGRSSASPWKAVADTLGDTVVVHTLAGSVWGDTASLTPEVSIGLLEGPEEYVFGDVAALARAPDGTLYVLDRQVPALRAYAPDGTYLRTLGRKGGGPGEYERPDGGLNVLSDGRVLLRDPGNARIQLFLPSGEQAGSWRIRGSFNTSLRLVVDRQDRVYTPLLLDPAADVRDWRIGYVRILPDGSPADTLTPPRSGYVPPRIEARHEGEEGRSATVNSVPFAPDEHVVLSPGGYFLHGVSTDYSFTLLKPDGPVRIRKDFSPVPVAAGERREEEAFAIRNMRFTDPNWRWTGPAIPDTKPAYRALFAGEDGTVWVLLSQPGVKGEDPFFDPGDPDAIADEWHEPVVFDVFDEEGRYLGAVRAPDGFSLRPTPLFTRQWVLATTRDALGVQTVVLFTVSHRGLSPTR